MPVALSLGVTFAVWLIVSAVLGNVHKAGLFVTLGIVLFHTSGRFPHFVNATLSSLSKYWVATRVETSPRLVYLAASAVLVPAGLILVSRLKKPEALTRLLNLFAVVLVAFPTVEVARTKRLFWNAPRKVSTPWALSPQSPRRPDVYYIILDGYARSDVMRELFQFDNRGFLDRLRQQGFYVAGESTSNYCQTPLSLSSSLNLDYLDDLLGDVGDDQTATHELIAHNRLATMLRSIGYTFVTFSTGFEPSDVIDADRYLSPYHQFTEFQRLLIDRTPIWAFLSLAESRDLFSQARDRTLFVLDRLPDVALDSQPTFTLAHLVCPHPPFLFGEKGEDVGRRDDRYYMNDGCRFQGFASDPRVYARSYRDQAVYITRRIEQTIDQILSISPEPPIIILQSDHGSGLRLSPESLEKTDLHERMSILNAYYFPDENYQALYPEITPVNSFRVVLNAHFDAGLPLLPDRNYFSTWSEPFRFMEVTDKVRPPSRGLSNEHGLLEGSATLAPPFLPTRAARPVSRSG